MEKEVNINERDRTVVVPLEKELREKFEAINLNAQPGYGTTTELMFAAYNLAKQEYAEMIKAQSQLLQSMGETNKQLAKRLGAINDIFSELNYIEPDRAIEVLNDIYKILNPAAPLLDGL